MHPIERLRYVARAGLDDLDGLAAEAAMALRGFSGDAAGLVTACRSLVDRHPAAGPMWWLASRLLCAPDPAAEAWQVGEDLENDRTFATLVAELPDDATVLAIGWPSHVAAGLRRRGDCRVLIVDAAGQWGWQLDRLARTGAEAGLVPESGIGAAVAACDVVLAEVQALGAGGFVGPSGSRAAAAVARAADVPFWAVAPLGRVLPEPLFAALADRLAGAPEPWNEPDELVPLDLVTAVVRSGGLAAPDEAVASPDGPFAPELLRRLDAPGTFRLP